MSILRDVDTERAQDLFLTFDAQTEQILAVLLTFLSILVFGFILTRIAQLFVSRIVDREYFDAQFKRLSSLDISAKKVLVNGVGIVGYVVTPLSGLYYLGVLRAVLLWVGVVVSFVFIWGGLLFMRDYVTNYVARRNVVIREGDSLRIGYVDGTVISCEAYYVLVKSAENHMLCVPYRYINSES